MTCSAETQFTVATLTAGEATGTALVLGEALNAWGGLDPVTGRIVHRSHPQYGAAVTGRVLVLPQTRGSGTNAQVMAQAWAAGTGPSAVILRERDYVLTVGAIVARELSKIICPVVVAASADYRRLGTGARLHVTAAGPRGVVTVLAGPCRPDPASPAAGGKEQQHG
jgi:predicted aconitase with swiveling domain